MTPPAQNKSTRFNLLSQLGGVLRDFPGFDLSHAFSHGQIASKKWLIEELERLDLELGNVYVLGGWVGILPAMMFESDLRFEQIRSFDLDPNSTRVAESMNRPYVVDGWKFKATTADMMEITYAQHTYLTKRFNGSDVELTEVPSTLINTSSEHLADFSRWWNLVPKNCLVAIQSNNFREAKDHLSCVESLEQFSASAPMSKTLFAGELSLPDYSRFMMIGFK